MNLSNLEGKSIYVFGIDGSGKSTLCNNLHEYYGRDIHVERIISDGEGGEFTHEYKKLNKKYNSDKDKDVYKHFENVVYALDHLNKSLELVEKKKNGLVILERYYICNWVYSTIMCEDMGIIEKMHNKFNLPDFYVYVDIDYQTAWSRIQKRGKKVTPKETPNNLKKASFLYKKYIEMNQIDVIKVDGTQNPIDICSKVIDEIKLRGGMYDKKDPISKC